MLWLGTGTKYAGLHTWSLPESQPHVTCTVWTCGFWYMQADRHTDMLIAILHTSSGDKSNGSINKSLNVKFLQSC